MIKYTHNKKAATILNPPKRCIARLLVSDKKAQIAAGSDSEVLRILSSGCSLLQSRAIFFSTILNINEFRNKSQELFTDY